MSELDRAPFPMARGSRLARGVRPRGGPAQHSGAYPRAAAMTLGGLAPWRALGARPDRASLRSAAKLEKKPGPPGGASPGLAEAAVSLGGFNPRSRPWGRQPDGAHARKKSACLIILSNCRGTPSHRMPHEHWHSEQFRSPAFEFPGGVIQ